MKTRFNKSFTQQEPIAEEAIARAVEIMRTGRLHRYNTRAGEWSEAALLEREFAAYLGVPYCLACASGGYAMHIALKAAGLNAGDKVLTNAFTLAPVPGAIHHAGGEVVLVEIDDNYCIDLADLEHCMQTSQSRFLLLSHMRGHLADMTAIVALCEQYNVLLIEDCAHTMGARWNHQLSGTFGTVACFSNQTYKHMNAGEGGFLTTDNDEIMAKAILLSGSYMLYERHGTVPPEEVFAGVRLETPNYSGRMDNLRAALLRSQLPQLPINGERWNRLYQVAEQGFTLIDGIEMPIRPPAEYYIGSSIQFRIPSLTSLIIPAFLQACAERGVELKWFGRAEPHGFTSRFDSWQYIHHTRDLPKTRKILANTFDLRLPLTFNENDMTVIVQIIKEVLYSIIAQHD